MDIIEINSSDSDIDSDFFDFTDSDDDNGTIASERFISPNHDSDNSANFATQQPQKRALPSYFHHAADRPTSKPGTSLHIETSMPRQQREPARLEPYNGSEMGPNRIPYRNREFDAKLHRTFPKGSMEPQGATQFHNFPGTSSGYGGANSSDSKVHNGERRILPLSLINGNSTNHAREKASMDAAGNDRHLGFHAKSSHSMGPNAAHRFPPIKNEKLGNITAPKASVEGRDEKGSGNYRVLPPTLIHGNIINGSHSNVTIGNISHSGIGEERHLEHDERIIYQEVLQNLGQPKLEDDLPDGLLSVHLLKHQKIALAWMVQKETSVHCAGGILADDQGLGKTISTIALIQKQMTLQSKFTSDDSHPIRPEALNLDEDDDGVAEVDEPLKVKMDDKKIENVEKKKRPMASTSGTSHNSRPAAGTLVVCPASVLRQWERELNEKVTETAKLSVLIYHGGTRTRNPCDLAKYDVILTTYSLITNEVPRQNRTNDDEERRNLDKYGVSSDFSTNKKRKQTSNTKKKGKKTKNSHLDFDSGPLARVRWFRVVLDEAQTIKNHRTQVARACCGLRAKRRWCLSGTPMQNSIDDLYSYFRFLKYDPYAVYSSFCSTIKCPISRNPSQGYKKLQAVLKVILLRRTKETLINGEPIVKLPPKTVSLKKIEFSDEERAFYRKLEADSRQQFKEYAAAGTVKQNYANILLMLLRLRQACDHPILVKKYHSNNVEKHSLAMARQLPIEMRINLLNMLNSSSICRLCNDTPEDAVVTMCGHVFCYQCVSYRVTGDENECPAAGCKEMLGTDLIYSRATLKSNIPDNPENGTLSISSASEDESLITQSSYVSSKISATVEILNSMCNQSAIVDPTNFDWNYEVPVKAIVFSQWTGMLDLVETSLNHSLIQYRRLDGSMTLNSRDTAVKDFNNDPEVTVMLMSLKAGNLGLNMTAASHVILLDLWWNPSAEDQAIDRAHRIGQTRPVLVSRLTVGDTVEDRILKLQEEKRQIIASAFGQDQVGGPATRLTVEDLRYLFGIYG